MTPKSIFFAFFAFFAASLLASADSFSALTPGELQARIQGDLKAIQIYRDGLKSAVQFASSRPDLFPPTKLKDARLLPQASKDEIRNVWKSYLDYILAIDAVGSYHREFYRLNGQSHDESLTIAYAAFLAQYRYSMEFIQLAENDPGLDTVLNDPVNEIGLPGGAYASLKFRFLNAGKAAEFGAWQAMFKTVGSEKTAAAVDADIQEDSDYIWKAGKGKGELLTIKNALNIVKNAGFKTVFPVQSGVAEWMGDTKVWRQNRSLVSQQQIHKMTEKLEPGDILLVRREWYLSNIGLPGFWPHAALYIGTAEERSRYFDDPDVKSWVASMGQADGDFEQLLKSKAAQAYALSLKPQMEHMPRTLEAISEGVSFTSIEHCADGDSVAVLRPRLSRHDKAEAILRAFLYSGRPYDFNFDFLTDAALVCTELVYKAYEPARDLHGLRFPLLDIMGRKATPANELVHQFDQQFGKPEQQTDLVIFLDGIEHAGNAIEASIQSFRESWKRPKWHIVTQ